MKTGIEFDTETVFRAEFSKALDKEVRKSGWALEDWFWSGRQKPETSVEWWDENGPAVAQNYIDWYENEPDASIWITPDGRPAIELDLTVNFGDIPVRMQIDQVLKLGSALVVVDLKGSVKAPDSLRQIGLYACGIELMGWPRPRYGAYILPRDPVKLFKRPVPLDGPQYSISYLARELAMFERGRQAGVFPANPGRACGRCGVAHACLAAGGARAKDLDPSHPHFRAR